MNTPSSQKKKTTTKKKLNVGKGRVFRGYTLFFLILTQKQRLLVLIRTNLSRCFYQAPTIYVCSKIKENITDYRLKTTFLEQISLALYCMLS